MGIIIPHRWGGIVGGVRGEEALVKFQHPCLVAEKKGNDDNRSNVDVGGWWGRGLLFSQLPNNKE